MNTRLADIICLIAVVASAGVAFWFYPSLPDQIPTHWNAAGEVDAYGDRSDAFVFPLIAAGVWLTMKLVQWFSPKGFRTDTFTDVVNIFQVTLVSFMAIVGVLVLLEAREPGTQYHTVVPLGVGLLFIVLGNYMGRVRKNFFIGIRTPWTLASDEVWARTHRLGGWTFLAGGVGMIVGHLAGLRPDWMVVMILIAALTPVVYSFVAYKRIEGFGEEDPDNGESSA